MNVAVIPARGGSQRIPRKNIRSFLGNPAIAITIRKALDSGLFDQVYVSTEDDEIAHEASKAGAIVPFRRSSDLSDNYTSTKEVVKDFIMRQKITDTLVTCLYPVTPLLDYKHIHEAVTIISRTGAPFVLPVIEVRVSEARMFKVNADKRIVLKARNEILKRTQDQERSYCDAGQFYLARAETWLKDTPIIGSESTVTMLSPYEVLDVDTEEDWKFAEELFLLRNPGFESSDTILHSGKITRTN
jgi:pseudaminic acid cytidylyltransferase